MIAVAGGIILAILILGFVGLIWKLRKLIAVAAIVGLIWAISQDPTMVTDLIAMFK